MRSCLIPTHLYGSHTYLQRLSLPQGLQTPMALSQDGNAPTRIDLSLFIFFKSCCLLTETREGTRNKPVVPAHPASATRATPPIFEKLSPTPQYPGICMGPWPPQSSNRAYRDPSKLAGFLSARCFRWPMELPSCPAATACAGEVLTKGRNGGHSMLAVGRVMRKRPGPLAARPGRTQSSVSTLLAGQANDMLNPSRGKSSSIAYAVRPARRANHV